jgi:hypothetical protein
VEEATLAGLDEELADVRQLRQTVSGSLGQQQLDAYARYEQALIAQRAAVEQLDAARAARIEAKKFRDAALRDTTIDRVTAIDTIVDAYVVADVDYRTAKLKYNAARRGVKKGVTPAEELAKVEALKVKADAARKVRDTLKKEMDDLLNRASRNVKGAGQEYAAQIYKLSKELSDNEFRLARFMADSEKLDTLFSGDIYSFNRETSLNVVGDMFKAYARIRRFIQPEDLASLSRAQREVYAARSVKDFAKEEAVAGKAGMAAMDMGRTKIGVESGKKVSTPRSMRDVYSSAGVLDVFEDMYKMREDLDGFRAFLNNVMDPLLLVWKTAVTVGRGPAYTVTNLAGGLQNNYLGGVNFKEHTMSGKVMLATRRHLKDIKREFGETLSYPEKVSKMVQRLTNEFENVTLNGVNVAEAFAESLQRGMAFSTRMVFDMQELKALGGEAVAPFMTPQQITARYRGQASNRTEAAWRSVVDFLLTNKYQTAMNDLAQLSELYLRFAAVLGGMRKFGDMESAMSFMYMLHFDYQDLSNFEIWLKRFVPFYTWTRNNVPLQLRFMIVTNDKMAKLVQANEELKNAFGVEGDQAWINEVLPEYMDVTGGFASVLKFNGNHIGLFPKLPFKDVDSWLQVSYIGGMPVVGPRTGELAESLGPIVSPLEFITNTDFASGQQFGSRSEAAVELAQTLVPYGGMISRVLGGAATVVPEIENINKIPGIGMLGIDVRAEKGRSDLYNFLLGGPFSATTLTERSVTAGAIQTSKAYNEQLRKLAAESNVDIDWLRSELKKGTTVPQLKAKIAMGQGNPAMLKLQEKMQGAPKKRASARDYREVLQGLGSGGLQTGY